MPCALAICEECYEKIESYGNLCLQAVIVTCDSHLSDISVIYNPIHFPAAAEAIDALENQRILKTMEVSPTEISIKPSNFRAYEFEDNICYCWCPDVE